MGLADRAALATGMPQEVLDKLKDGMGSAETARWLRHLADLTGEAKYVVAPGGGGQGIMTREQAIERRFVLTGIDGNGQRTGKGDQAWMDKHAKSDGPTLKEWNDLLKVITAG
jgi:NADPH-dependent 2,4-dienoyl-CoA reductase/sulfur reductase-like enzyme